MHGAELQCQVIGARAHQRSIAKKLLDFASSYSASGRKIPQRTAHLAERSSLGSARPCGRLRFRQIEVDLDRKSVV